VSWCCVGSTTRYGTGRAIQAREELNREGRGCFVLTMHVDSDDTLYRHCLDNVRRRLHPSSPFVVLISCLSSLLFVCHPHPLFVLVATLPLVT
jgi:hypothetical protein